MCRASQTVLILILYFGFIFTALAVDNPADELDAYIIKGMIDNKIPGLAIAIVKDDKIIYMKGYGVRELGKSQPVDENTVFAIASTTKAFTTTAISMLVDEGKVNWDKPVIGYLPDFLLYDSWVTREITIRDVFSNRSGLDDQAEMLCYLKDRNEIVRRLRYVKPATSFRSQYAYRNPMFIVGGQIIPAVTGISWDDFIIQRILKPLGMKRSFVSSINLTKLDNVATPHTMDKGKIIPISYRFIDALGPAGSINSCVYDMAQWVRLHLGRGTYEGKRLVSADAIEETHKPNIIYPISKGYRQVFPSTHFLAYCMGWIKQDYQGYELLWHLGGIDGMRCVVCLMPEKNLGLVILTNYDRHDFHQALLYTALDLMFSFPPTDYDKVFRDVRRVREEKLAEKIEKDKSDRAKNTHHSLELSAYAGDYHTELLDAIVTLKDNQLILDFGPIFTGKLDHWQYDTFRVTWDGPVLEGDSEPDSRMGLGFVTFEINSQGKVTGFRKDKLDPFVRVEK